MLRSALTVAGGTAAAQALTFLTSLLVARLVMPEDYGAYAVVASLAAMAGAVASLRLDLAVPLPDTLEESAGVCVAGQVASAMVAAALTAVLAVAHPWLGRTVSLAPDQAWLLVLAGPMCGLIGGYAVTTQLAVRARRYPLMARQAVVQALLVAIGQVGAASAHPGASSLVAGTLAGQLGGLFLLRHGLADLTRTRAAARLSARPYSRHVALLTPSALVNVLGLQLPLLLVARLYGPDAAGNFGMTQRLAAAPVTLVGAAIGQVFLGELTALRRQDPAAMPRLFRRSSIQLALLGVLVAVAFATIGPFVANVLLGARYRSAGDILRALSIGSGAQVVAGPLSVVLVVAGLQSLQLAWDVGRVLVVLGTFALCTATGMRPLDAFYLLSLVTAALYLVQWLLCTQAVHRLAAVPPSRPAAGDPAHRTIESLP